MSWYEFDMYAGRYRIQQEEKKSLEEAQWARFRLQWADFRNVNRGKNGRIVKPQDLIKLSFDDRVPEYHEIDIGAIKRRLGSKLKPKNG